MMRGDSDFLEAVDRELRAWRTTHPHASFAEIEAAVEERIRQLRARLLEETIAAGCTVEQPACPHCGTTMVRRTERHRTVVVQGEEAVGVHGPQVVCPVCGTGLFPPR